MTDNRPAQTAIPVLTDVATDKESARLADANQSIDHASLIAELQTQLASSAYTLTEEVLHAAFTEMEATLFEQISTKLRRELPELIDRVLREHLSSELDES